MSVEHLSEYGERVRQGPTILHADLDAFYASVEQLLDPALLGRPIAVGGSAQGGVVLAASYEAKAYGVQGRCPGWRARELCPDLVFVGGHFGEYQRLADEVMTILGDFTPLVERISIDEAFLDVTGATHLFGPPAAIAAGCAAGSATTWGCRSRSGPRGPSTWPRSRPRSPSPTGRLSSSPTASVSSSIRCLST